MRLVMFYLRPRLRPEAEDRALALASIVPGVVRVTRFSSMPADPALARLYMALVDEKANIGTVAGGIRSVYDVDAAYGV